MPLRGGSRSLESLAKMSPPTPAKTTRYQALDMWRGLICLFVVLEHAAVALWQGLGEEEGGTFLRRLIVAPFQTNWGTPLFFVISGYCIASSVESSRRKGTAPGLFLVRRFWRVFPSYWVALLGFMAVVAILDVAGLSRIHRNPYALELPSVADVSAGSWIGNFTLTETWRPLVSPGELNVFTRVAWSLCYQEQFYMICFLALLVSRRSIAWTLGMATVAIVAFRLAAGDVGWLPRIAGTFPLLWHQFAIGLSVYWFLNGQASSRGRWAILATLAGMVVVAPFYTDGASTAVAAGFGLAMIGFHRFDAAWARVRHLEPLRAMGRCSYSIYLAHLPVIVVMAGFLGEWGITDFWARAFITVPLTTAASILAGIGFYRLIESRFLEIPSWVRQSKPAAERPVPIDRPDVTTRPGLIAVRASA